MFGHTARRFFFAVCACGLLLLAACDSASGTASTATGNPTATTIATDATGTSTPPIATSVLPTPTPTATTAPTGGGGPSPTATPRQPQTVIYGYSGGVDILTAFDVVTRAKIWHRDLGGTPTQPVLANGILYVSGEPYYLEAFDAHSGAHIWKSTFGSSIPPLVSGNLLYNLNFVKGDGTTFTYNLMALNARTGAVVWQQTMNTNGASLILDHGTLYVPGLQSSTTTTLYSYDAATGAAKTTYTINAPFDTVLYAVSNGVAYYACGFVYMCAANLATQTVLWKFHNGGVDNNQLTVANGVAYFGADDNHLYAVNATSGTLLWSYLTGGSVQSKPIVVNGNSYFSSTDGYYYGLSASGGLLWKTRIDGGNHDSGQWFNGQIYFPDNTVSAGVVCVINPTTGKLTQLIYIPAAPFVIASW